MGWKCAYCIKKYKKFLNISKAQTATKKYFAYYKFNVDVCFLLFFSSSRNDDTKCSKKGCETGNIDPFTTKYDLIILKQQLQKSQKFV